MPLDQAPEHEFEAQHGLPQPLPSNERILWQGSPSAALMARHAMHTRLLSGYFALLLAWRGATVLSNGGSMADAAMAVAWLLPLAVLAIAVLTLMGWLISRTSVYTVTDRRVVMRIGVVLSITFNIPFSKIESAALHEHADGSGDLALSLSGSDNIAFVHLWPHARPWKLTRTQPMLRGLPDARHVADVVAQALLDSEVALRPRLVGADASARQPAREETRQPMAA